MESAGPEPSASATDAAATSNRSSHSQLLPSRKNVARWYSRNKAEILGLNTQYARGIRQLAEGSGINPYTIRRRVERRFVTYRKDNGWNAYQAWAKRHKDDPDAPTPSRTPVVSFQRLAPQRLKAIKQWAADNQHKKDAFSVQKDFNRECRNLVDQISLLQSRFGFRVAAVVASSTEGVPPFFASTTETSAAMSASVGSIGTDKTVDDLVNAFEHAVKLKVWTNKDLVGGVRTDAVKTPTTYEQVRNDLIDRIHKVVGPVVARKKGAIETKWIKATKGGTRLRYRDLFSLIAETGCYVKGWPLAASQMISSDASTNLPAGPELPTHYTIWRGSLKNQADWRERMVSAVAEAIKSDELRVVESVGEEDNDDNQEVDDFRDGLSD